MAFFRDRADAAEQLIPLLPATVNRDWIILGLARGGIPIAARIADALGARLDVLILRKVGAPGNPELALAAVTGPGPDRMVVNEAVRSYHHLTPEDVEILAAPAVAEVARRRKLWLDGADLPSLQGRDVLLVDDGMATGTTMRAAIGMVRHMGAARIGVAVPVALGNALRHLPADIAPVLCPHPADPASAVGAAYAAFPQVEDQEVRDLIKARMAAPHGEQRQTDISNKSYPQAIQMLRFRPTLPDKPARKKMAPPRILVVDDDPKLRELLRDGLTQEGWTVHEAANRQEVFDVMTSKNIDVITLDLCLQNEDGLTIARELRAFRNVPILMVTARAEPFDRVTGLEHGADDYVVKPFLIREVVLRIKRLLGTYTRPIVQSHPVRFDHSTFDPNRGVVEGPDGAQVSLTAHEQKLLQLFALNPNRVLSRDEITTALTGREWSPLDRTIDVHIAHLRRKLGQLSTIPQLIRSVRGVGYVFAAEVSPVS